MSAEMISAKDKKYSRVILSHCFARKKKLLIGCVQTERDECDERHKITYKVNVKTPLDAVSLPARLIL